jgi:branched-chain amino acid transport system substrate-binding protein
MAQHGQEVVLGAIGRRPTRHSELYIASGPDEIGPLVKQLRKAGVDEPVFGGDGYDTPLLLQIAGAAANDVYFTTHALFDPAQASPLQKEFFAAYQARFGTPPESSFAGLGYDAVNLLAAAIEGAGSAKQKVIRGALEATQGFPGVTGTISFAPGVHIPEKQVTIVRIKDGALTLAAIITPEEVPSP